MIAYTIPGEAILSGFGTVLVLVAYLAVGLNRQREKVARLEEWVRLHERQN